MGKFVIWKLRRLKRKASKRRGLFPDQYANAYLQLKKHTNQYNKHNSSI